MAEVSRAVFLKDLNLVGTEANQKKWQKNYTQGINVNGEGAIEGHQTKLHIKAFVDARGMR